MIGPWYGMDATGSSSLRARKSTKQVSITLPMKPSLAVEKPITKKLFIAQLGGQEGEPRMREEVIPCPNGVGAG